MAELTLSDTLRNYISNKVDESYDFSLQSSRKADLDNFILINKSRGWKSKSVRPSYHRILDETLKNKGIDLKSLNRQVKRPKYGGDTGITAEIKPMPVSGKVETTTAPAVATSGAPRVEGQQQQQQVNPFAQSFDAEGVGATFSAITVMFRLAYPEFETLSDIEKSSLGKMWLPFFQKYLTENMAVIGVPLLATIGMLLPKLLKARKLNGENKIKSEIEKEKRKLDSDKKPKETKDDKKD